MFFLKIEVLFVIVSLVIWGVNLILENKFGKFNLIKLFVVVYLEGECYGVERFNFVSLV